MLVYSVNKTNSQKTPFPYQKRCRVSRISRLRLSILQRVESRWRAPRASEITKFPNYPPDEVTAANGIKIHKPMTTFLWRDYEVLKSCLSLFMERFPKMGRIRSHGSGPKGPVTIAVMLLAEVCRKDKAFQKALLNKNKVAMRSRERVLLRELMVRYPRTFIDSNQDVIGILNSRQITFNSPYEKDLLLNTPELLGIFQRHTQVPQECAEAIFMMRPTLHRGLGRFRLQDVLKDIQCITPVDMFFTRNVMPYLQHTLGGLKTLDAYIQQLALKVSKNGLLITGDSDTVYDCNELVLPRLLSAGFEPVQNMPLVSLFDRNILLEGPIVFERRK